MVKKEVENWQRVVAEGKSLALASLERSSVEHIQRDVSSFSGVGIGAQDRVQWVVVLTGGGGGGGGGGMTTLAERAVDCAVG